MKLMVFDVGGTEIKYSVMDETLERRQSGSVPTPMTSQEDFFDILCELYAPHRDEVEGIAISPALSTAKTASAAEAGRSATTTARKSPALSRRAPAALSTSPMTANARRSRSLRTAPSRAAATPVCLLSGQASAEVWSSTARS